MRRGRRVLLENREHVFADIGHLHRFPSFTRERIIARISQLYYRLCTPTSQQINVLNVRHTA